MKTQTCFLIFWLFSFCQVNSQLNPGNLVVLQVGDGTSMLSGTGNNIVLREFNVFGVPTASVAFPTTGSSAMILRGNAQSEGYLSRSADNNYVVVGAYMQSLPNANTLNSTAASNIARGIALVDVAANIQIVATSNVSALASGDIRCATASNSLNAWACSSSQGTAFYGTSASPTVVQNAKANARAVHIFNNQLFLSSQVSSGTPPDIGIYAIGSGTPNTSAQTLTTIINAGSGAQPGQFYFNNALTICYVADARNANAGGIQKWVLSSGTWSLAYTIPTGTNGAGAYGIVADFNASPPKVYATTTESSANRIVATIDNGSGSTATTIATASVNTAFRGLTWSPGTNTCIPVSVISVTNSGPVCSNQSLSLQVNAQGSTPINYAWYGAAAFSSTAVAAPVLMNAGSGNYSVMLSNACGTTSALVPVTVYAAPVIQVNAATICAGGIATITASGANSYTWNNNSTAPQFIASPSVTTLYTVTGTSAQGCTATPVTTSIAVVNTPSITLNTPVVCAGKSATLIAQGGSSYTWTLNQSIGASLVVSPSTTTQYTVNAIASGCANTVSAVGNVSVLALPNVSITNAVKLFCQNNTGTVLTANPIGGVFSGPQVVGNLLQLSQTGQYTVSYSYTNTNQCSNTAKETFTVNACLMIDEQRQFNNFTLFPNPFGESLFIHATGKHGGAVKVYDGTGNFINRILIENDSTQINTNYWPSGIYVFVLEGDNAPPVKRIKP